MGVYEPDPTTARAVVIRFPDADEARRWYESPEYQALARHRWNASAASIIALEGFA